MTTELALVVRGHENASRLWIESTDRGVHLGQARDLPRIGLDAPDVALAAELGAAKESVAVARKLASVGVAWFDRSVEELSDLRAVADDAAAFAARMRSRGLRPRESFRLLGEVVARGDVLSGHAALVELRVDTPIPGAMFIDERDLADAWASGKELPSAALSLALRTCANDLLAVRGIVTSGWEVAPFLHMLPVRSPTLPPATHTNAFLIGDSSMLLVEPASPFDDEVDRIVALVERHRSEGRVLDGIVLTHHHPDHVGGAMALRERLGAPIFAHARTADRLAGEVVVDRILEDGERIVLDGRQRIELDILHTPGHAPGHLCLLERASGALIAGDMVAGVGTILVEPHDGDMSLYLESLARLRALGATMILPAHGGVVRDPKSWLDFYVAHRLAREAKIVDALDRLGKPAEVDEIVPIAYADTSPMAWPLARMSTFAHLDKLLREGRVLRVGNAWELVRRGGSSVN